MFDNLRDDAASAPFYEEDIQNFKSEAEVPEAGPSPSRFLGMTPFQRFVIAFLLLLAVCVIGALLLLVTGKIGF
ncbi:MAG: hypothetical protein C4586_07695 [Anaerolineaceae bacterium]|nr:MAG: hypothetical protein C4586_07695 [Anaerolineaceae bacterium]